MTLRIGVDVGGTKIAAGLVEPGGTVVSQYREATPTGGTALLDCIVDVVRRCQAEASAESVGIGLAGFVDRDRSTVSLAPNLDLGTPDVGTYVGSRVGLPTVVENDAAAAAWAEYQFGAGADHGRGLLMVTVGTGVGGGIVSDDGLMRGGFGAAGEIGHLRLYPQGRRCSCGQRGCLEQYASGNALVADTRTAATDDPDAAAAVIARAGGDPARIAGSEITDAAKQGDPFALAQVDRLAHHLGLGISTLVAVLDPALIVIGGGVADAGQVLLDPLTQHIAANVPSSGRPAATVALTQLGTAAGLVGAAELSGRTHE